jgi:hypothetical protein
MLNGARQGFKARFERQVDPLGELDPSERAARADRARRAHMLALAYRSAEARRGRVRERTANAASNGSESPDSERAE